MNDDEAITVNAVTDDDDDDDDEDAWDDCVRSNVGGTKVYE